MLMNGYAGHILRVDLNALSSRVEEVDEGVRPYLGGSALATKLLGRMNWKIDPFDPDMEIAFVTGPITGTPAPSSARYVVAAKSPRDRRLGRSPRQRLLGTGAEICGI
jgi:aldehyde:ferredoxin oxidoreductase